MNEFITFRGRSITEGDVTIVRKIIAAHPDGSRRFISQERNRITPQRRVAQIRTSLLEC